MCPWMTSNVNQKCVNKLDHVVLYRWVEGEKKKLLGCSKTMVGDGAVEFQNGRTR